MRRSSVGQCGSPASPILRGCVVDAVAALISSSNSLVRGQLIIPIATGRVTYRLICSKVTQELKGKCLLWTIQTIGNDGLGLPAKDRMKR